MGFFKVTVGVMGSSKSARAIAEVQNLKIRNLKTLVVKPSLDTRDGAYICSRLIKDKVKADILLKPDELLDENTIRQVDYIVVDEFHMLTSKQIEELYKISAITPTNVSLYGLRLSWQGTPFESAALALAYADEIEIIKMVDNNQNILCHHVKYTNGEPSPLNKDEEKIVLGDLNNNEEEANEISYKPVSKKDFYEIYMKNYDKTSLDS